MTTIANSLKLVPEHRAGDRIDRSVGARIRELRKLHGLSQGELGDMIGVTFQQIQKYENGKNSVRARRLYPLAKALRCRPDDFFSGLSSADAVREGAELGRIRRHSVLELVRLYDRCDGLAQTRIRELVKVIAEAQHGAR